MRDVVCERSSPRHAADIRQVSDLFDVFCDLCAVSSSTGGKLCISVAPEMRGAV